MGVAVKQQLERDQEKAIALSTRHLRHHKVSQRSAPTPAPAAGIESPAESGESKADDDEEVDNIAEEEDEDSFPADAERDHEDLERLATQRTVYSQRTALGYSLTGVDARHRATNESETGPVFIVGWEGDNDPQNPHNWSRGRRIWATVVVGLIAIAGTAASSIDAAVIPQYSAYWHISEVAATLATAMYLFGFALGSQFAGPFSETLGRNVIYISTMLIYMLFLMGCGLAPSFGAHIVLRFFAGVFASSPLTVAGGTIADLWNALEKTWAFSLYAALGFSGPLLGPVIGSYIGPSGLSWRWNEYLMLVLAGIVLAIIVLAQPETYAPLLLSWKAKHLRLITGDDRFRSPLEVRRTSFLTRLRIAVYRPFVMIWTEPIILLMSLYLTILYIVLFSFFVAFSFVFTDTYGISQGLTNIIWVAVLVGFLPLGPVLLLVWRWTLQDLAAQSAAAGTTVTAPRPETRLWFAMLGGVVCLPISLFWMGWTDYSSISIWSPIVAAGLFGYSVITLFISVYMYIIDSYAVYAASALTFVTVTRYLAAGGFTIIAVPWFENLGVHYTLTILACISALMTPVPFGRSFAVRSQGD